MTADAVGGIWPYALDLARALPAADYAITLAVLGPAPSAEQRAAAAAIPGLALVETGLPLDWLAPDTEAVLASARAIAALAVSTGADLVQVNSPALAAVPFPLPVVAVAHSCLATWWDAAGEGALPDDFRWRIDLHAAGLRAATRVVTPSAAFSRATAAAYGLPVAPTVVLNGRSPLPLPSAERRDFALTVGRLWDGGKNVAVLDRAAARLGVPFRAAGATSGPGGASIALNHLIAIGHVDDARLGELLATQPVFASAARYEPFGLAVLEAAAAGCALVLSDIPTFRELWSDAAIFVDAQDSDGFARALQATIDDPRERTAMGERARSRAAGYTPAAMAAGLAAVYRDALAKPALEQQAA